MNFPSNINIYRTCLTSIAMIGLSVADLVPAFGSPSSQIVKYESPQQEVLTINLHPGLGTNISFDTVNQTVETIFLDNQSNISMNTNGCLPTERTCPAGSAPTLIHLSLIDEIELPGVIHVNKQAANKSLLTVVSLDANRQKHTYIFTLKLFGKKDPKPHVALIQIVPFTPKPDVRVAAIPKAKVRAKPIDTSIEAPIATVDSPFIPVNLRVTDQRTIDYLATGFRLAIYRGDFKYNNPQYESLNKFTPFPPEDYRIRL